MKPNRAIGWIMAVMVLLAMVAGCMNIDSTTSGKTRFYTLAAPAPDGSENAGAGLADVRLGLGPVSIPSYINRSQIVTRVGPNEIKISEFHLWAAPLNENILRVLGENIARETGSGAVFTFPWKQSNPIDYQITVRIVRFDATTDGLLTFIAKWAIYGNDGKELLLDSRSEMSRPVQGGDYSRMAEEMSRLLEDFSAEMVLGMRGVISEAGGAVQ